jgi:hypothetical protein
MNLKLLLALLPALLLALLPALLHWPRWVFLMSWLLLALLPHAQ